MYLSMLRKNCSSWPLKRVVVAQQCLFGKTQVTRDNQVWNLGEINVKYSSVSQRTRQLFLNQTELQPVK